MTISPVPVPSQAVFGWVGSLLSLSPDQMLVAQDLLAWISRRQPTDLGQALINRTVGFCIDPVQMRLLEQDIIRRFNPLPRAAIHLKVLCKMVDAINAGSQYKLPIPRIPHLHVRPKNPFFGHIPAALQQARRWREAIRHQIEARKPRKSPVLAAALSIESTHGLVFASAIIHGGLIDTDLVVAVVRALSSKPDPTFGLYEQRLCIELSVAWQGVAGSEHRFWYPDPLTGVLISEIDFDWLAGQMTDGAGAYYPDKKIKEKLWKFIRAFFMVAIPEPDLRPQSLTALIRTSSTDLATRLPMVLHNYAARKIISHSPESRVLDRIHYGKSPTSANPAVVVRYESTDTITDLNKATNGLQDLEPVWLGDLRRSFTGVTQNQVVANLKSLVFSVDTPEACFHGFAVHLLTSLSTGRHRLALSTARSYLVTAAKTLGGRLGDVSPQQLPEEILEGLYTEILEDAVQDGAKGLRRRLAQVLREFHAYLVARYGKQPIQDGTVLGAGRGLVTVDANLITFDEYDAIQRELPNTLRNKHPTLPAMGDLAQVAKLLFMLAFKCGLRRMEALMLKCNDVAEHDPVELLIRPSDARGLKSKSSTRKLPLYALLDQAEIDELIAWKVSRLGKYPGILPWDIFLFAIPELGHDVTTQDLIFPVIHEAMRKVSGDPLIRYHHLRHSFASWTFLRLMLSDLKQIPHLFADHPKTAQMLGQSRPFREKLYGRSDHTRRHAYATASLLGHSGPDISFEHYIHVCDLMLTLWRDQDLISPAIKQLKIQANRPKSSFYRWLSHHPSMVSARLIVKRPQGARIRQIVRKKSSRQSAVVATSPLFCQLDANLFERVWNVLYQHSFHHRPLDELAAESGIPLPILEQMIRKAREISEMKVSRGRKGFQHRMMKATIDRRLVGHRIRLFCPENPQKKADQEIMTILAPKLATLMGLRRQLCEAVFDNFVKNAWGDRTYLPFRDLSCSRDALNYLEFMKELGIGRKDLDMLSYDNSLRSSNIPVWRSALSLPKGYPIRRIGTPSKTRLGAQTCLAIKPVFETTPKGRKVASPTIRYLLIMGAIISAGLSRPPNPAPG